MSYKFADSLLASCQQTCVTYTIAVCTEQSITSLRNEKPQFKVALKNFYVHTPFTLWMNFLHVQKIYITDLHDCVNSYTVIILYVLHAFVCF